MPDTSQVEQLREGRKLIDELIGWMSAKQMFNDSDERLFRAKLRTIVEAVKAGQESTEHHALADARWNRDVHRFLAALKSSVREVGE